jgi:hypothetical protein
MAVNGWATQSQENSARTSGDASSELEEMSLLYIRGIWEPLHGPADGSHIANTQPSPSITRAAIRGYR